MRTIPFPGRTENAPRLLVVWPSSLRGAVHGLPVLSAVRTNLSPGRVVCLAGESAATLLDGHAGVDRVICLPDGSLRSPLGSVRLWRAIAAERFDVAIDLAGSIASGLAVRLSGSRRRIGFAGRATGTWCYSDRVSVRARNIVEHYLALLRPLDVFDPPVEYGVPVWSQAGSAADGFLSRARLLPGGFAILDPAADRASQAWPPERYGEVARYLGGRYGLPTVAVWYHHADREAAEVVVQRSGGWGHLAPPTTTRALAELARRAALFVGSDTGALHLAAAIGTPTVSLHGSTPASWSGAYGPNHVTLQAFLDARPSKLPRADRTRAIRAISVETVCTACTRLLVAESRTRADKLAA